MARKQPGPVSDLVQDTKNAVIYVLCDPRDGRVRYVGKTTNPALRLRRHIKDGRDGKTDHKSRWIAALLRAGERPFVIALEICTSATWKARECHWIATFRAAGCDLTNCKDGGDGLSPSVESRARMRAAKIGRSPHNKGKTTSSETRARQRIAAQKRWEVLTPDERIAYMAPALANPSPLRAHTQTPATRAKIAAGVRAYRRKDSTNA